MSNNKSIIVKTGQVESIDDTSDGMRVKARILDDKDTPIKDLPYAFPLLPKSFRMMPKVGESVKIFCADFENPKSDRYYIGPIISQDQYMENDQYNYGRGSSDSMSNGTSLAPLEKISMYAETEGSFPKKEDVAIVGRTSEDVILKDGEIDIRCGIRQKPTSNENPNIKGHVLYNNTDPSYIQLKYEPNLCGKKYGNNDKGTNSVVNIVSDKINLISYSDPNQFNLTDKEKLISKEELLRILDNMHPAAYADELITILKVIINAVYTHVHPYPGMSPCNTSEIQQMTNLDLNKVKSDFVRIS